MCDLLVVHREEQEPEGDMCGFGGKMFLFDK